MKQASQVSEQNDEQINSQTDVYGMNGPGKTKNSYDEEKLVVRECKTWPPNMMVANVDKSGVGERKTKLSHTEVTSKNKSGERERMNKPPTEQTEETVIVIELNSKDNKMCEQTDQQKTVIEQLCEQTDMNEQTIEQTIA